MTTHRFALACVLMLAAIAPAAAQDVAPAPGMAIALPAAHERWRETVTVAASEAASVGHDWLGPHPAGAITTIHLDPPLWQGRGAMRVEAQAAQSVLRSWWPELTDHAADAILDGFAWYLQGRAIERLYDRRYLRRGYSADAIPLFGGDVIWSFPPLRMRAWTAAADRDGAVRTAHAARHAELFMTLERWLGEPALQGAMFAVARMPADRISAAAIVSTISAAAGQDLSWLFAGTADPAVTFDYALTGLALSDGGSCAAPCYETRVTVARLGPGQFTGQSAARAGAFDSGDALALQVTFADGAHAWARWDGRDDSRTFTFEGPSVGISAHLDPHHVLAFDANRLNNTIVSPSFTNAPVGKWMARWIVWMQNTLLSYGFFA